MIHIPKDIKDRKSLKLVSGKKLNQYINYQQIRQTNLKIKSNLYKTKKKLYKNTKPVYHDHNDLVPNASFPMNLSCIRPSVQETTFLGYQRWSPYTGLTVILFNVIRVQVLHLLGEKFSKKKKYSMSYLIFLPM